jgi:hypothetical protein
MTINYYVYVDEMVKFENNYIFLENGLDFRWRIVISTFACENKN